MGVSGRISDITDVTEAKRSFLATYAELETKKQEVLGISFAMDEEQVKSAYRDIMTLGDNLKLLHAKIEELEDLETQNESI